MIRITKKFVTPACFLLIMSMCLVAKAASPTVQPADMIIYDGKVWTVDESLPRAHAIAIRNGHIVRVGEDAQVMALKGPSTKMIDLKGALALPGFIDAHTHFENATEWYFQASLNDIDREHDLIETISEITKRVPKGMWITGGDWGRSAARKALTSKAVYKEYVPSLDAVDRITPDHPVLIRRHDGAYFINSKGMALLHFNGTTPNPLDGELVRDPSTGKLSGMLLGAAGPQISLMLPPKSRARTLVAARAILAELNSYGLTGIHDISRVDAISQTKIFHSDIERSFSDVTIFTDLKAAGDLSLRVYPIVALGSWSDLKQHGITPGSGDDLIRYGAVKAFIDGSLMFEPFDNNPSWNPNYAGNFAFRVVDGNNLEKDIIGADSAGFDIATHVLGDKAHSLLLDWYEAAIKANPPRDRRFRLIHAWYPALSEIERAGRIHAIADITPAQFTDDLPTLEAKLGPSRLKTAYAWRTMIDNGIRLDLVSDWPGNFNKHSTWPIKPLELMQTAVLRDQLAQKYIKTPLAPQALTIQEAIRAYTINPAFASHEENIKGSIREGKLADIVILSRDILKLPADKITSARILYTILGGKIVYNSNQGPASGAQQ
jgi:predicted amidohydrolase YtcJ